MLGLACLGMLIPAPVLEAAVTTGTAQPQVAAGAARMSVALGRGGALQGRAIDANGAALGGVNVSLRRLEGGDTTTVTDPAGYFAASGLRDGTYEIVAGRARGVYRAWAPNAAPPSAPRHVVVRETLVRQQSPLCSFLGNPWVIAGIVATAVAIPVAIHNSKKPASP